MKNKLVAVVLFSFMLLAAPARGEIIVDHQPQNSGGGVSDTLFPYPANHPYTQRIADDFLLNEPSQAVSLVAWGFYDADNPPVTETMRIRIYGARAGDGLPDDGNIISETTVGDPTRTATGRIVYVGYGPREFRYEANLSASVSLEAGIPYWLELVQIGDISATFRWEDSVNGEFNGVAFINPYVVDWRATWPGGPANAAFQLITPEAATIAMLALGFVLLARKRRSGREARWNS